MRLLLLSAVALWAGCALLFAELRWFRRPTLVDRIRPYSTGATLPARSREGVLSVASLADVIGPLARSIGDRVSALFGVAERLETRIERIHADIDVTSFRLHQLGWSVVGFAGGASVVAVAGLPSVLGAVVVLGAPLLCFLVVERDLVRQSAAWQRRLVLELPVVAEQLGMLLAAGFSLGGALARLATRGHGAVGRDLGRVVGRVQHGLSEVEALREWAALASVAEVDRLVAVLALNRDAGDLGRLVADEARSIRRQVQRELVESIERRAQQVWIPVTVAALVPGVLFLSVPFVDALQAFSGA